ncbi:MAG TPA: hypothetical protein VIJ65_02070 [Acidobacteriaceae bacterium]
MSSEIHFTYQLIAIPEHGKLEAEIQNEGLEVVAIVYEDAVGWHVGICAENSETPADALVESVKEEMRHFVNRTGQNVPEHIQTRGDLSLWLMVKDDGTALGMPYYQLIS